MRYVKDNRILPRGFDKATADADVAVSRRCGGRSGVRERRGPHALQRGCRDAPRVPIRVDAELWYQPIGFRWAQNLRLQPARETNRFVAYFESMADVSAIVLARDSVTVP